VLQYNHKNQNLNKPNKEVNMKAFGLGVLSTAGISLIIGYIFFAGV
jgi:hypothetical protein